MRVYHIFIMNETSSPTDQDTDRRHTGESQSDHAFRIMEQKIVCCELEPGELFTEKQVSMVIGFGRTPTREAIQKLSYGMLLHITPRSGLTIAPVKYHDTVQVMQVRILLEKLLVELAVSRSSSFEKRRFTKFSEDMHQFAKEPDKLEVAQLDDELNRFVADTAGHDVAARHSLPLHTLTRRLGYLDVRFRGPQSLIRSAKGHAELCEFLAEGDIIGAHSALDKLYELNLEVLEALIEVLPQKYTI
jgi:DNA-binding GntR family transcriptional regulator